MATDEAPKSAYEIAMERLRKKDKDAGVAEREVTEAQKAELDRRIDEMVRDGERGIPWKDLLDRIRGRAK